MDTEKKIAQRLKQWFSDFLTKFVFPRVLWRVIAIVVLAATSVLSPWWASYFPRISSHFQIVALYSALPAILGAFVVPILLYNRQIKRDLSEYKSIASTSGIEGFWHFSTQEDKDKGWKVCNTKLAESRLGELSIAGLSGAQTFADLGSPLRDALENHRGPIRILLIDKDSPAFVERVRDMAGNDPIEYAKHGEDYRHRIDSALLFCVKLGEKSPKQLKSIEVRAYERSAIWKMVIFGNYMWLQHYVAGKPGSDSPAYMLSRDGTLSPPLERVFDYRWKWAGDRKKVLLHRNENGDWIVRPPSPAIR